MIPLQLIIVLLLKFPEVFGSRFIAAHLIHIAVQKCCPETMQNCCKDSLRKDRPIHCASHSASQSINAAICLEKYFYNGSIIQTGAHKCCWLMSSEKCSDSCEQHLLQPTLPFSEKFSFIDGCPSGASTEETYSCLHHEHPLRDCFSLCRGFTEKRMKQLGWNEQDIGEENEFEPLRDCPIYKKFMESSPCIFNTEK
uniref:Domain of unknown function DB domain-containing protein n=1 Tax=Ditylenchus dipsaci TaxID=166011 RepID=A0A915D6F8_9BILA